jgi:hypothetical protein
MNVEIGTEAALFPEKEYINGIFLAVFAPAEGADTLPLFVLYPYCTLWSPVAPPAVIYFLTYFSIY